MDAIPTTQNSIWYALQIRAFMFALYDWKYRRMGGVKGYIIGLKTDRTLSSMGRFWRGSYPAEPKSKMKLSLEAFTHFQFCLYNMPPKHHKSHSQIFLLTLLLKTEKQELSVLRLIGMRLYKSPIHHNSRLQIQPFL